MEKNLLLRNFIYFLLIAVLLFPVGHLLLYVPLGAFPFDQLFLQAVLGALIQASLSTAITIFAGLLGGLALSSLKEKMPKSWFVALATFLVVPSFLPPIVVICLVVRGAGGLPMGLWGVVLFHVLMNMGFVSVLAYHFIARRAVGWLQVSLTYGVPLRRFFLRGLLPGLRTEILFLAFYLMILYFFSFSIPMLVGGAHYSGVEVFIYEKIVLFGQWGEALTASVVLFAVLFALSLTIRRPQSIRWNTNSDSSEVFRYLGVDVFLLPPLLATGLLFLSLLSFLVVSPFVGWTDDIWSSARGTMLTGIITGLILFFLLSLLSYCFVLGRRSRIVLGMVNPGWVVVGFSFLLMGGEGSLDSLFKTACALALVFFPFLYRMALAERLSKLEGQVQRASLFPVSWFKIYFQVILPDCLPLISFLSGVGAVWACGDFALTSIVLSEGSVATLALDMKNLIMGYRLEQAVFLLGPLLVVSAVVFFLFQGIGYVCRRKILS